MHTIRRKTYTSITSPPGITIKYYIEGDKDSASNVLPLSVILCTDISTCCTRLIYVVSILVEMCPITSTARYEQLKLKMYLDVFLSIPYSYIWY